MELPQLYRYFFFFHLTVNNIKTFLDSPFFNQKVLLMASMLLCKPQPRVILPTTITRAHFLLFYLLCVMLTIGMSICVYIWYCKKLCCYYVLFITIPVANTNII